MKTRNKKENLIPELRFPEFKEEWNKIPLQKFARINPNNGNVPNNFYYIDLESISKGEISSPFKLLNKEDAPSRAQRFLKKGNVLFQTVRPYQKNNYYFNLDGDYVASTGYTVLDTTESNDFLYQLIHTENFVNAVLRRCTGTSYPAISTEDLKTIFIKTPTLPEQQKISSFLSLIDRKIELLNKKKELLEIYKKGVMQKIFNRDIRFKDINGNNYPEWEEKKLGEICKITTGKLDANAMVKDGKYRFYTCAADYFHIDNYDFDTEALIISGNGANVGYIHYYKGKFNAYQRTYVLSNFINNIHYIKIYLEEYLHKRIDKEKKSGNTPYIVLNTLKGMIIKTPSQVEEKMIFTIINSLNIKTKYLQNSLFKLQIFKNGLLQKMFI